MKSNQRIGKAFDAVKGFSRCLIGDSFFCKLTKMKKTLGERIRELREEKDLSLREFAKKLSGPKKLEGLSAAFLSDVELGRRHPSDEVFANMARILGTKVEDLREYDTRPPVEDIKRLSALNPAYGLAFRKLLDKDVSPEDLIKLANKKPNRKKPE